MKEAFAILAVICVATFTLMAVVQVLRSYVSALRTDDESEDHWDARRGRLEDDRRRSLHNLHEVEFDHQTGKIDDNDYRILRARYEQRAVLAMNALEQLPTASPAEVGE